MLKDHLRLLILSLGISINMYIIDKELHSILNEINFETDNEEFPFYPNDQIQACSIDLRLSDIYWKPQKFKRAIDLRSKFLIDLSPTLYWKRKKLNPFDSFILRPGDFILARTYEKFSIPKNCAGKIEGRSSYSRMGLMIQCSGDFINPGWRGHMPMQLVNLSPIPIKISPYIPICQIMLIKLSDIPNRTYGVSELQSKYIDDEGGPSHWWADKSIKRLQEAFSKINLSDAIIEEINKKLGNIEPEIKIRLEKDILRKKIKNFYNSEIVLTEFSKKEEIRFCFKTIVKILLSGSFFFFFSYTVDLLINNIFNIYSYIIFIFTFLSIGPSFYGFFYFKVGPYLRKEKLKKII